MLERLNIFPRKLFKLTTPVVSLCFETEIQQYQIQSVHGVPLVSFELDLLYKVYIVLYRDFEH